MGITRSYILDRVRVDDNGCWVWQRSLNGAGYPNTSSGGDGHRRSYELWIGPIPDGAHVDHACRNRACVNPDHLRAVGRGMNVRLAYRRRTGQMSRRDLRVARWLHGEVGRLAGALSSSPGLDADD